jgi:mono/diheme cytochrome c family protein
MSTANQLRVALPLLLPLTLLAQDPLSLPAADRIALHMSGYVGAAAEIRQHVIRGDLENARAVARALVTQPTLAKLAASDPWVAQVADAAEEVANAPDLVQAAGGTARMSAACGSCHQTLAVRSVMPQRATVATGGVVGHMLNHERAIDDLHAGLIKPSDALWLRGADGLKGNSLNRGSLPPGAELTNKILAAEARVHQLASRARTASATADRVHVYTLVLASCAECHRLHPRLWGPAAPQP